jgi:hypothetical protein
VRAERAEDDRRGKRKRGDEQAESGVHPGYPRDTGARLRASNSHLRRQPLFVYECPIEQHRKANQRVGGVLLLQEQRHKGREIQGATRTTLHARGKHRITTGGGTRSGRESVVASL